MATLHSTVALTILALLLWTTNTHALKCWFAGKSILSLSGDRAQTFPLDRGAEYEKDCIYDLNDEVAAASAQCFKTRKSWESYQADAVSGPNWPDWDPWYK